MSVDPIKSPKAADPVALLARKYESKGYWLPNRLLMGSALAFAFLAAVGTVAAALAGHRGLALIALTVEAAAGILMIWFWVGKRWKKKIPPRH